MELFRTIFLSPFEKGNIGLPVLVVIYLVGAAGILTGFGNFLLPLSPLIILTSVTILWYYYRGSIKIFGFGLMAAFFIGFGAEYVGIHTGLIFGDYEYGPNLRPLIAGVPVVIGLNWFLVTYGAWSLIKLCKINPWLTILSSALLATALDLLIEPVAMKVGFWSWEGGQIPLSNYIGWFFISLIILLIFKSLRLKPHMPSGALVFALQVFFFGLLLIFL